MEWRRFVTYLWNDPRNTSLIIERRKMMKNEERRTKKTKRRTETERIRRIKRGEGEEEE